jgi:hypothetical protein
MIFSPYPFLLNFCHFLIILVKIWPMEKVDGSVFFWSDFCLFLPKSDLYGFIEKQAPQKALCLGPDPPLAKT